MLETARAEAKKTANEINKKEIKAKVKADIKDLQAKIRDAKQRLKETHNQKTQAKIKAEIAQLRSQVAAAKSQLRSIKDKTVWIQYPPRHLLRHQRQAADEPEGRCRHRRQYRAQRPWVVGVAARSWWASRARRS